ALGYPGAREALAGQRGRRLPQAVAKGRTTERAPGGGSQLRRVTAWHEEGCLAIAYYLGRRPHPARDHRAAARQVFEEGPRHAVGLEGRIEGDVESAHPARGIIRKAHERHPI